MFFVILTTFCLESYFKGLLTFIGIFVILTTFCLGSYFKGLLTFIGMKYDPRQNVVRMTKISINVSRPLKYDPKQNVVRI
jgi:hypothetical protein